MAVRPSRPARYPCWSAPPRRSSLSPALQRFQTAVNASLSSLVATAEQGDRAAADALFTALYHELHRMARRELAKRSAGVTLGATTLLHEAYMDISGREGATSRITAGSWPTPRA